MPLINSWAGLRWIRTANTNSVPYKISNLHTINMNQAFYLGKHCKLCFINVLLCKVSRANPLNRLKELVNSFQFVWIPMTDTIMNGMDSTVQYCKTWQVGLCRSGQIPTSQVRRYVVSVVRLAYVALSVQLLITSSKYLQSNRRVDNVPRRNIMDSCAVVYNITVELHSSSLPKLALF